jgi:hypothetical protein
LASSLNFYGKVDMDYLMQSTDSAEEEIIGDLKGEIFYNRAIGEWEHKGKFVSRLKSLLHLQLRKRTTTKQLQYLLRLQRRMLKVRELRKL